MIKMSLPRILIVTPFRNESCSISHYLKSVKNVDYPKKLIDLYWLENDSSDDTLKLLKEAKPKMPFNSTILKPIKIHGPTQKREPGQYVKGSRKRARKAWLVIWNKYFLPLVRRTDHEYVLFWYADAVAPPTVITEYLKVFDEYPAGWVGGKMHRRYPRHEEILSPWPRSLGAQRVNHPHECLLTGHVFMIPRTPLCKCRFYSVAKEMHYSIIHGLNKQRLKVFYQPTVYIEHVSTDGKIHTA